MTKTKIIETTEKYDKDGKLVEKITREETSEDNTEYAPHYSHPGIQDSPIKTYRDGSIGLCAECISVH